MTPSDAQHIAKRGRKLLRRGDLTHRQYALLDCLLWSCRAPGRADARVSYTQLQRLAHMARETIARGLRHLAKLGLLRVNKYRLLVAFGGITTTRQDKNVYTLISGNPQTAAESSSVTVNKGWKEYTDRAGANTQAARTALAAIAARRTVVLMGGAIGSCL